MRETRALDITLNYNRMSKETVNRPLTVASAALWLAFLTASPAQAQTALVAGSVRDQHGAAIAGATVVGRGPAGARVLAATTTDGGGTFVLPGNGVARVTISCRYCVVREIPVAPGEPVVAIVVRYAALIDQSPSRDDFANLPYAHVESALALKPFTLLQQSTQAFPGSQLSDRGLQPSNALLVDAGVPNYDVAFGASPYATIPAAYELTGSVESPAEAFTYGDRAGSGIVNLTPFGDGGDANGAALAGGDTIARLGAGSSVSQFVGGTYSNDLESRQRADAALDLTLSPAESIDVNAGSEQGRQYGLPGSSFAGNFTFARAAFDDDQPNADIDASFVADRGGYAVSAGDTPASDVWSDARAEIGVRSRGSVQTFAGVSTSFSTGEYDADSYYYPAHVAGTVQQNHVDAGVEASGPFYDLTAGIGWFGVAYAGGAYGAPMAAAAQLATPSLQLSLLPQAKWSAQIEASDSFTLPTLWQQYYVNDNYSAVSYDRNTLYGATIAYTDDSRLRASAEAASQRVRGYDNGIVTSDGLSLAWQVAPLLSLRAWTMHVDDETYASYGSPYDAASGLPNVNAFWMTYENGSSLRIDAIYRRDVLDGQPFEHVDGAVSGPVTGRLRWYAGVEDRQRVRYLEFGVRLSQ